MNWGAFFQSLGKFFSGIGQTFLANVMAAIPQIEQAAINFLTGIVDTIITDIETGVIPLPALAVNPNEPGAVTDVEAQALALGKVKRDAAFNAVKQKLAGMTIPEDITVTNSLIYWQIETSVRKYKTNNSGNGGNFPGGNSGPVAK
jgi:hypothetical protein